MNIKYERESTSIINDGDIDEMLLVKSKRQECSDSRKIPNNRIIENEKLRLGEERLMKCGMKARIIAYRKFNDVDVQFDDGTIVKNCSYSNFQNGYIRNSVNQQLCENKHIGEKRKMNNGMNAEIIAYRSYKDIDVRFEDGIIEKSRRYDAFAIGNISHHSMSSRMNLSHKNERIGEKRKMNCEMYAEIIAYRRAKDIDVKFEDGTIVNNRTYGRFIRGQIANPSMMSKKDERIGEERLMNCGMKATIIAYRNAMSIDIQFEDGTTVKNRIYSAFKKGQIRNPNS